MLLTEEKIKNIFKKLLNGEMSREEVNKWAYKVMQEGDKGNLNILPDSLRNKIKTDGIMYLLAVDHQMYKDIYDESMGDIRKFYEEKWLNYKSNNEVENIQMDFAIDIDDNWVQCSNKFCEEVFVVTDKEKYVECPKCLKIQLNPRYKSQDPST